MRMVAIIVQNYRLLDEVFVPVVAQALREYASALEAGEAGQGAAENFKTTNGCEVRVIAGSAE